MNQSETDPANSRSNPPSLPIGKPITDWRPATIPPMTTIDGQFCRLESLDARAHAKSLFDANTQDVEARNWTYLPYGPFESFEEYSQWLNSVSSTDDPLFYTIISKSSGKAVGVASYLRIKPESGSIEVGHIHFSPLLKRSPPATEAMFLMMKQAFDLGYRRYEWKCDALNAASCSAAQRLGLSFEGIFRQATVYKGRNRDTAWFAAVDSDWPALEQAFVQWLEPGNFDEDGRQKVSLRALTQSCLKPPANE